MNLEQVPELIDVVSKVESRLMQEMANLIDARDVPFAVSAYTTALSRVIGAAIAMSKSDELRKLTHEAVYMMIGAAIQDASASYAADEAIEKASKV